MMFYAQSSITVISGRETVTERQRETERHMERERETHRKRERETHGERESDRDRDPWKEKERPTERENQTETGEGLSSDCGSKAKRWAFHGTLSFTKLTFASSGT